MIVVAIAVSQDESLIKPLIIPAVGGRTSGLRRGSYEGILASVHEVLSQENATKRIDNLQQPREYGIEALTGESDAHSYRIPCDVTKRGKSECGQCGQRRGHKETRYFYWRQIGERFFAVHASEKSKFGPLRTVKDSFSPSTNYLQKRDSLATPTTASSESGLGQYRTRQPFTQEGKSPPW